MKNENEISDYFFIDKEELDDHFGQTLTQEDMDDLRGTIDMMDRNEIVWWIIDYYSWKPNENMEKE